MSEWFDGTPSMWAAILMVGFPVLFLAFGEAAERLALRHAPVAGAMRSLRNFVLPLLVLVLTARFVASIHHISTALKIVHTLFWIASVLVAISFVNALLFDEAAPQSWRANVPTFLKHMSRGVLVLVGFAIIVSQVWDADLKGALTALGVGSIVLGFALQGTLGGIVSGIALLIDRPFREGDTIKIGEWTGTVHEMNWRSVRILSGKRDLVVIPNGKLAEESITNLSRPEPWHVETFELKYSFNDPPTDVKAMLLEVIASCSGVMQAPPPRVRVKAFGDFAVIYEMIVAIPLEQTFSARDDILSRLWYASQRKGFSMPLPASTSFGADAFEVARRKKERNTEEVRKALSAALSLDPLLIASLVEHSAIREYAATEFVLHQGGVARALFFVVSGKGAIGVPGKDGEWVEVGKLSHGDIFGAGSLLRGEPSPMSLRALADMKILEIPADAVFEVIKDNPQFAVQLQQVMAQRQKLLVELTESHISPQVIRPSGNFRSFQEMMTQAQARSFVVNDSEEG